MNYTGSMEANMEKSGVPAKLDEEDLAFNRIFREEGAKEDARIAEAGRLPSDKELTAELRGLNVREKNARAERWARYGNLKKALEVFARHRGEGLVPSMPLGNVAGFFEVQKERFPDADHSSGEAFVQFVSHEMESGSFDDDDELYKLMQSAEKERDRIKLIFENEEPEVNLAE